MGRRIMRVLNCHVLCSLHFLEAECMHAAETAPHSIGKRTRCLFPSSYVHIESCLTAFGCNLLTIHEAINRKRVYFSGNQPPEYNSFVLSAFSSA